MVMVQRTVRLYRYHIWSCDILGIIFVTERLGVVVLKMVGWL